MADGFTQAEQYLLQLTNRERIRVGSQPVANYSVLDNSADGHSDKGFATDTFQHETDLVGFISSYGFEWRAGYYGLWETTNGRVAIRAIELVLGNETGG